MRLVLLPHAGGSAMALPWRALLPPALAGRVVPLELPGRGRRFLEPAAPSLQLLAREVAATVRAAAGGEGVVLQGHSMGALLAYEAARELAAMGVAVRGLVLSGREAPHWLVRRSGPPRHLLTDAELVRELRRLGGTAADVLADPGLMELLLPVVRADFRLVETYRRAPGPPLAVPAVVLGGIDDPATSVAGLHAWDEVLSGPLAVERWPGGHFFLHDAPERFAALLGREAEAMAGRADALAGGA